MRNLINAVFGLFGALLVLLGNFVVGVFAPVAFIALIIPFIQLLVFANNWVAGGLVLAIAGIFVWWAIASHHQGAWVTGAIGGLLALVIFASPAYFQLLALFFQIVVLFLVIWVPGIVSVRVRSLSIAILVAELIFTTLLMTGVWGGAVAPLIIIGVLVYTAGTLMFNGAARPNERRKAQRRAANFLFWAGGVAVVFSFAPFWWPRVAAVVWSVSGVDPRKASDAMAVVAGSEAPLVGSVPVNVVEYDSTGNLVAKRIWYKPGGVIKSLASAAEKTGKFFSVVGEAVKKTPAGSAYRGWAARKFLENEEVIRNAREAHERDEAHADKNVADKRRAAALDYYDKVAVQMQQRVAAAAAGTTP
jgi:hypothetical protein